MSEFECFYYIIKYCFIQSNGITALTKCFIEKISLKNKNSYDDEAF